MTQASLDLPKNPFAAQTTHALRGDYANMRPDYTVDQPYHSYTEDEQERWRFLFKRQKALLAGYASKEFIDGLNDLKAGDAIPRLEEANEILGAATGWRLVAVPGLIP